MANGISGFPLGEGLRVYAERLGWGSAEARDGEAACLRFDWRGSLLFLLGFIGVA